MNKTSEFLAGFISRGGGYVLGSGLIVKLTAVITTVIVARSLTDEEFGTISFLLMLITPVIPLAGLAQDFSYLRKAPVLAPTERLGLYKTLSLYGLAASILISCAFDVTLTLLNIVPSGYSIYLVVLTGTLILEYIIKIVEAYLRVESKNSVFSKIGVYRSLALLVLVSVTIPLFGPTGYVVSLICAPLIAIFLILKNIPINLLFLTSYRTVPLADVKYGAGIGVAGFISQLQLPLAGIIYGNYSGDMAGLALYKVATVIPFSLMFVPNLIFKSEFVHIVKGKADIKATMRYLYGYWSIVGSLFTVGAILYWMAGKYFLLLIFGEEYAESYELMAWLLFAVFGAFLLRQPFGNILAAKGFSFLNLMVSIISTAVYIPLTCYLVDKYKLMGAVYSVNVILWSGGLALFLVFIFSQRRIRR